MNYELMHLMLIVDYLTVFNSNNVYILNNALYSVYT